MVRLCWIFRDFFLAAKTSHLEGAPFSSTSSQSSSNITCSSFVYLVWMIHLISTPYAIYRTKMCTFRPSTGSASSRPSVNIP